MSHHQEKHIALFGGAFDPPHFGHALAIRQILDTKRFDEVWVTPTGTRPDKTSRASTQDRRTMITLMLREVFTKEPVVLASHILDANGALPTSIDEMRFLTKMHPSYRFTIAIGRDQAEALPTWNDFEELRQETTFLILARDGAPTHLPDGVDAIVLHPDDVAWMNISSTHVRNQIRAGAFIEGTTTGAIERYIAEKQLYRKE